MKTNSILFITFISLSVLLATPSCKKNKTCGEENISSAGSDDSHNFGQNCMSCHKLDGKGEGCFVIAGSVSNTALSNPLTSGTVRLYTAANGGGTLKHTLQIDAKGNFHTTDNIDFTGLYASVTGPSGTTQYMGSALSSGSCNSCHGSSTSKLWGN